MICKYFLPVDGLYFHHNSEFQRTEVLDFDEVQFLSLFSYGLCFGGRSKNLYAIRGYKFFSPIFSRNVMVLSFTFRSMIHFFLLTYIYDVRL